MTWPRAKLKFVVRFGYGDAIPTNEVQDGPVRVFGSNGPYSSFPRSNTGAPAIIVGRKGSYGKINWTSEPCFASDTTFFIDSSTCKHELRWAYWLLQTLGLDEGTDEAAVPGLNRETAYNKDVTVPPRSEQHAIADYLDRETARLDALVAAKERVLGLLAEKRRALITQAVTCGLNQHVPMRNTGIEWIPQAPRHWTPTKISRLFQQTKRLGFADLTVLSVYRDYGVIERSSRDDNANRVPDDLDKYQLVEPGDLVINKMKAWQGSLGIAELRGITSPDYVVFRPLHHALSKFLHYLLRNQILTTVYFSMSNGIRTSQWRLEPDRFGTLQLFLPPIDEQHEIVAHIVKGTAKVDALHSATKRTILLLKERRAALIAAAVTGLISVVEADT